MRVVSHMTGLMSPAVGVLDDIGKPSAGDREERETKKQQQAADGAAAENTARPSVRRRKVGKFVRRAHEVETVFLNQDAASE